MTGRIKGVITGLVSVCVLIILGVGIALLVQAVVRSKAQSQIAYQMTLIDSQIAKGQYLRAEQLLNDLKSFSLDFSVYKQILRRAEKISTYTKDYSLFLGFTESAARLYPKERDAVSLYVYSLLKNDRYDQAYAVADEAFHGRGVLPTLLAEAALRSGNGEKLTLSSLDSLSRAAVSVAVSEDPNGYRYLSDRINDSRLIKNYILSLAVSGHIKEAFSLFDSQIGRQHPLLGSYLAYDAGEYETAYSYAQMLDKDFFLENNRDWFLFLGDLSLVMGVTNEAAALYSDFVETYPDYSYVPYYNLALLYKDSPDAVKYMEQAVAAFPGIAVLNLKLADDYVKLNAPEKAKTVLENFLKLDVDNVDAVLAYHFLLSNVSPERFIGALWNLYNNNKGINEKIPQVFLWYLTGLADSAEMDRLLVHCRRDFGDRSWIDFYAGVSSVLKEDFESAYSFFSNCTKKSVRSTGSYRMGYQPFYNCALLSLYFGYPERALSELESARAYIDWNDRQLSAAVHVLYGRIYLMKKDNEKAMRSFRLAHDMDPSNIEVISYLDYLNSGIGK